MTARTPGPWYVDKPFQEPGVYIAGPSTALICKLYEPDANTFYYDQRVASEANAAFIVLACNSHDALTAENAALREALRGLVAEIVNICEDGTLDRSIVEGHESMLKARAALAKG